MAPPSDVEARAVTIIRPLRAMQWINVGELWRHRELIGFLIWRDVKVRFKQTVLGAAWAILQPALMMIVFTLFFRRLAGAPSGGVPYPLFAYAGLLPWTFFATAITNAGQSVVGSERLITKIYFPRLAIPFAAVGAAVVDFVVACSLLAVMMLYYGVAPGAGLLLVPVIVVVILLGALGVGTLLAALNVSYRDFRYVVPFLVQLWMFATPSVYMEVGRAGHAPATYTRSVHVGILSNLNFMDATIAAFRTAALGGAVPWRGLAMSSGLALSIFFVGCLFFRKVEDQFADVI